MYATDQVSKIVGRGIGEDHKVSIDEWLHTGVEQHGLVDTDIFFDPDSKEAFHDLLTLDIALQKPFQSNQYPFLEWLSPVAAALKTLLQN